MVLCFGGGFLTSLQILFRAGPIEMITGAKLRHCLSDLIGVHLQVCVLWQPCSAACGPMDGQFRHVYEGIDLVRSRNILYAFQSLEIRNMVPSYTLIFVTASSSATNKETGNFLSSFSTFHLAGLLRTNPRFKREV